MIFVIGVVSYLVGRFMIQFCHLPFEATLGARIGLALVFAGLAMVLGSCLILAWEYVP
jgi:hypothetical protein